MPLATPLLPPPPPPEQSRLSPAGSLCLFRNIIPLIAGRQEKALGAGAAAARGASSAGAPAPLRRQPPLLRRSRGGAALAGRPRAPVWHPLAKNTGFFFSFPSRALARLPSTVSSGSPAAGSCAKFPLADAVPQGRSAAARSWGRGAALQVATAPPAPPVGERPPGAARRGRRGGGCAPCAAPGARRGPGSQEAPRRVWPARPARPRRAPAGSRPGRGEGHGGEPGRGGPRREGKKKKEEREEGVKKKELHRIRVLGRAGGSVPLPLPLPHSFLP